MKRVQANKVHHPEEHKKTAKRIMRSTSYKVRLYKIQKSIGSIIEITSMKKSKKKEKLSGTKMTNADLD